MGESINGDGANANWEAPTESEEPVLPKGRRIHLNEVTAPAQLPTQKESKARFVAEIRDKADRIQQFVDGIVPDANNADQLAELKQCRQDIVDAEPKQFSADGISIMNRVWVKAENIMRQLG